MVRGLEESGDNYCNGNATADTKQTHPYLLKLKMWRNPGKKYQCNDIRVRKRLGSKIARCRSLQALFQENVMDAQKWRFTIPLIHMWYDSFFWHGFMACLLLSSRGGTKFRSLVVTVQQHWHVMLSLFLWKNNERERHHVVVRFCFRKHAKDLHLRRLMKHGRIQHVVTI